MGALALVGIGTSTPAPSAPFGFRTLLDRETRGLFACCWQQDGFGNGVTPSGYYPAKRADSGTYGTATHTKFFLGTNPD